MSDEQTGLALGIMAITLFGLTLPITKLLIPIMHPVFIGLGRAALAGIVALIILLHVKQKPPTIVQGWKLLIVSSTVVIGFPVLSAMAMQTTPASHGGVVMGIAPLATAAAGALFGRERPSIGFWLLGLIGTVLVITFSLRRGLEGFVAGDLLLLLATVLVAIGYALGGILAKEIGGWQVICWALVISFPVILIPSIVFAPERILALPMPSILAFLYLALVSQLLGFFLWYKGMAIGGVARVSQSQLLQPFVTILASALLLNEPISLSVCLFACAVMATVFLGKRMPIKYD